MLLGRQNTAMRRRETGSVSRSNLPSFVGKSGGYAGTASATPGRRDGAEVRMARGQARTSSSTRAKWQLLAPTTNECQTSWYPNTSGRGSGRARASTTAPIV